MNIIKQIAAAILLAATVFTAKAQTIVAVESQKNALVLQVTPQKQLNALYFGGKLANQSEYEAIAKQYKYISHTGEANQAYSTSGSTNILEPALAVTHADGNRSLALKYVDHKTTNISDNITLVSINLRDSVYNFEVTLNYQTYIKENVTEQWTVIKHHEKKEVVLNKYASANLYLQNNGYWLNHSPW